MTDTDKAQAYFHEILEQRLDDMRLAVTDNFVDHGSLCESPIERLMFAALMFCPFGYATELAKIHDCRLTFEIPKAQIVVAPQFVIGQYRVDFAVFLQSFAGDVLRFAVECDGHEFHEKTKEQARRDKSRDRALLLAGWPTFRFTGSEIYRDVDACVAQLDSFGSDWIEACLVRDGIIHGRPKR